MRLIYGTHNPAKVLYMKERLASSGLEIVGLNEFSFVLPEVVEDGNTPLENAGKKALTYYRALKAPVFSCDSGLYLEGLPEEEQPGIHVRTIGGKYLSDEEMVAHYTGLVAKYGNLRASYRNAICLVMDENHVYEAMEKSMESEPFLITAQTRPIRRKGFPLDSFSVDMKTGKHFYDLDERVLERVAVTDGFLEFFHKCFHTISSDHL